MHLLDKCLNGHQDACLTEALIPTSQIMQQRGVSHEWSNPGINVWMRRFQSCFWQY